jgi:Flp pilus assembly pilin Flp
MTLRRIPQLRHAHGQTATEYAVLLALVFAVVVGLLPLFGGSVAGLFTNFLTQLASVFGG